MQLPRASHLPRPLHATTCAPPHPTHSAARGLSALSVHNPQYRIAPHLSTTTRQRNPPAASAPSSSSESPLSAPSSRHSRRAGCTQQVGHRLTPVSLDGPTLWAALREALKGAPPIGSGLHCQSARVLRNRSPTWIGALLVALGTATLAAREGSGRLTPTGATHTPRIPTWQASWDTS